MIQNEDLRAALRNLRKYLKEERDFRMEDISALSTRLTGSTGQLVRLDEEQVSKTQQASCDYGAIRRNDGSVDFNRTWADYKAGIGDLIVEFWLGNEYIYQLTKDKPRQLRIDMEMFNGRKRYALYSEFKISSESENYKLHLSGYTGDGMFW
ncbi:hypothetical protein DPMN_067909 [Dreissena polymorpha]|uniref:Fibrinogen C-terminal domain-containing protein n=1 Tax=Dreissena polymorpha TaxID=45954 RepID=A0A9D3YW47_DREPO|nr:hypothetical protein DPMN_067909 [Dreissena polymorpha]